MVLGGRALAQHPIPESERWATITHPGNIAYQMPPTNNYPHPVASVDYEYQISRTEVTGEEWFEFVQAYAPYVPPEYANSQSFASHTVRRTTVSPGVIAYSLIKGAEHLAVRVGWRFAARYTNWLHNGKALTPDAFERGVYDTSTFGQNPNGSQTDQMERSPGATYFIPTIDEWMKAAYFDPDRYGENQPGYWNYPNSSDVAPIGGVPGIGETSAGYSWTTQQEPDVGAYPDTQSPWGLLDLSGGQREFLETAAIGKFGMIGRFIKGSQAGLAPSVALDYIEYTDASGAGINLGVRIARVVPAPGVLTAAGVGCLVLVSARRRR
jgi:formylglycine-generating enzyme required for sulfatase activity